MSDKEQCEKCEGTGAISYSANNHSFCPACHGKGVIARGQK